MKTLFIAIMGQISLAIVTEKRRKVPIWNTLSVSQNPFHLIQMLTRICQTGDFGVPTDSCLERIHEI